MSTPTAADIQRLDEIDARGLRERQEKLSAVDKTVIGSSPEKPTVDTTPSNGSLQLPVHNGNVETGARTEGAVVAAKRTFQVRTTGESGRRGIHPVRFLRITFKSSSWVSRIVNVLWPIVPVALAVNYAMPNSHLAIFILSYLAMVPCANLLGFAGQELSRKVPHVIGVLTETT